MGLTWRDLASSALMLVVVLGYAAAHSGSRLPGLSTVSAMSAAALALGTGCAILAAADLHTTLLSHPGVIVRRITSVAGSIGLAAGVLGVISGSWRALEYLVVATVVVWAAGTCWHILGIGSDGPDD
jgi:hypothetical protein